MTVVSRFAPSPTGYLHIGGARTALFSWLVARKEGGKFILRMEDTDRQRSTDESTAKIIEDLRWLGLDWDEGPYFQSQRLDIYNGYIEKLMADGRAYKCFETPEQLDAARQAARREKRDYIYDGAGRRLTEDQIKAYEDQGQPCVIRFRMPDTDITVNDAVLGEVTLKAEKLEDFVIRKSDGFPTFHLAVVVDDYLMGVTHVLRGQEHLMNTPKHIALQQAMGFTTPIYAHMPVIFNMNGSKMSKRDKEKAIKAGLPVPEIDIHDFRAAGYLPETVLNFIALLGWSPGNDIEFMTLDELTKLFGIDRIGKSNAKFDREKLSAFNAEYIKKTDLDRLRALTRDFLSFTDYPLKDADDRQLDMIIEMYRERSRTLVDMAEACRFFFVDPDEYDPKAVKKVLSKEPARQVLIEMQEKFAAVDNWTAPAIHECIENYAAEHEINMGKVAQPIRVAVSGGMVSPPIDQTLEALGKERTLARLKSSGVYISRIEFNL